MFEAMDYELLTGRQLREGYVLSLWVALNYPQMLRKGSFANALERVKRDLGSMPTKSMFLAYLDRGDLFPNMD
jgi:hypothetical protein